MTILFRLLEETNDRNFESISAEDVVENYGNKKTPFSIIAPVKEKTSIKICHGSHRINNGDGSNGTYGKVHQKW